jgi:hypothetical protein
MAAAIVVLPMPISPMHRQIGPLGDRLHAVDHGGGAVGLVHRRGAGDVAGRALERQFVHLQADAERLAKLVDGRAAGLEIGHHLGRHGLRKGRDGLVDDAVIAGEHRGKRTLDGRRMAALPGGEPLGDLLQPAEGAGGLGQLGLALARRRGRLEVGRRHLGQHGADRLEGGWGRACVHVALAIG